MSVSTPSIVNTRLTELLESVDLLIKETRNTNEVLNSISMDLTAIRDKLNRNEF